MDFCAKIFQFFISCILCCTILVTFASPVVYAQTQELGINESVSDVIDASSENSNSVSLDPTNPVLPMDVSPGRGDYV